MAACGRVDPDRFRDAQFLLPRFADRRRRRVVLVARDQRRPPPGHTQLVLQIPPQPADIAPGCHRPHDHLLDLPQMLLSNRSDQTDILGDRGIQGFLDGRRDLEPDRDASLAQRGRHGAVNAVLGRRREIGRQFRRCGIEAIQPTPAEAIHLPSQAMHAVRSILGKLRIGRTIFCRQRHQQGFVHLLDQRPQPTAKRHGNALVGMDWRQRR
jgi:hypothetical protein